MLAKAERAARMGRDALAAGAPDAAAARAFYALLYAAKTLLNERGLRLHAHARIAAAVEAPLRDWLAAAIARRREGDVEISHADAEALLEQASAGIAAVRERIR